MAKKEDSELIARYADMLSAIGNGTAPADRPPPFERSSRWDGCRLGRRGAGHTV